MLNTTIAQQRLHNQLISQHTFERPEEVVQWFGAVQAQDYAAAKWAVGLRLHDATDDDIEQVCNRGAILRTHVMRPTWHFVSPADIRWLLALTAPRVKAAIASWHRTLELDDATLGRCNTILANTLQGGHHLTRQELTSTLQHAGIAADDPMRVGAIFMNAELDGVVCSGARHGKQSTYALLDERAPHARMLARDAALAELVRRYFMGHGPATLQDFVWWSGLTTADAQEGLAMVKQELMHERIDDQVYWFSPSTPSPTLTSTATPALKNPSQATYLLPNYDEYIVGYKKRDAVFDDLHTQKLDSRGNVLFNNIVVTNGLVVGTWKRTIKKEKVSLMPDFFLPQHEAEMHAFAVSAQSYAAFLALSLLSR
jgi:hypothetical protein